VYTLVTLFIEEKTSLLAAEFKALNSIKPLVVLLPVTPLSAIVILGSALVVTNKSPVVV
jgi:hypothetical protein